MINSKGIKVFCYIIMGFVWIITVVFLVLGISKMADKNWYSIIFILLGLLLPLICSISLYPIFALASIDENIRLLNEKTDELFFSENSINREYQNQIESSLKGQSKYEALRQEENDEDGSANNVDAIIAICFICEKYGIALNIEDDVKTIKEAISTIENPKANILKNRVADANTKSEILRAFIAHKVANG